VFKMKITVLGCGTFVPELKRHAASYLFEIGKEKIVFDFGRGILDNLIKTKINLEKINTIFITHTHTDHIAELSSFLSYVLDRPKARKYPDTKIYGPKGIKKTIKLLFKAYHLEKHKYLNKIKIKELSNKEQINFGTLKIKAFEVIHSKSRKCFAYRIEIKKKTVCYSGDSGYCTGLKEACENSDLAIVEANLPESWNIKEHLTGKKVGKLANETKVKKLVLTHIASFYLPQVKKDVAQNYKGKIIIVKDLMKIKV